jgi:hypothetical protein
MGTRYLMLAIALLSTDARTGGGAGPLETQEVKEQQEKFLSRDVDRANDVCESKFNVTIDWSELDKVGNAKQYRIHNCQDALYGIASVCKDPHGKAAVNRNISKIICGFGSERTISLEKGNLNYTSDPDKPGDSAFVFDFLADNLRTDDAEADTLKIRSIKTAQQEAIRGSVEQLNRMCRSNIDVKFDWSFMPAEFGSTVPETRPEFQCRDAFRGIRSICDDPIGENAVKREIKSVTCGFDSTPSVTLKDGGLAVKMKFRSERGPNSFEETGMVFRYLRNQLRAGSAEGDPLRIHWLKEKNQEKLAEHIREFNKFCDSDIAVAFDWNGLPTESEPLPGSPEMYCGSALEGIQPVCRSAAGRDAVKKKIRSVSCGFGPEPSISLQGNQLGYKMNLKSLGDSRMITKYLEKTL